MFAPPDPRAASAGDPTRGRELPEQSEAFLADWEEDFEFEPPAGGYVCYLRYLGDEGVAEFCRALLEEAGVVLLPASIFASSPAEVPADRFRIGLGRRNPEPALQAFGEFLRGR